MEAARAGPGPGHPVTGVSLALLADVLRDRERTPEASDTYDQAVEILSGAVPPGDPNLLSVRAARAEFHAATGREAEALEELRGILAASDALGPDHPVRRRVEELLRSARDGGPGGR